MIGSSGVRWRGSKAARALAVIHRRHDGGIQSAQGWSMGWVQGEGSAKAPFPVSMTWSGVSVVVH